MSSGKLVFVTGASGFLGSHIVQQLLENGFRVRAAARGAKAANLEEIYAKLGYDGKFEAISITDIASDEFPEALKGVDAIIHAAAPIPAKASPDEVLHGAIEGMVNVLRQAHKAGIKKIVVTSSIATYINPKFSFTDEDWNPTTKEEAIASGDGMNVYSVAKTLAEQELWKFVDAHPELDVTTLNPPFLYGPLAPGFSLPTPNYPLLSTDLYIYNFLSPAGNFPSAPFYIDVRDAAKAHIFALTSRPSSEPGIGRKRLLIAAKDGFVYQDVVNLLKEKRPELKDRLIQTTPTALPFDRVPFDAKRVEAVIGFKESDYTRIEDTMLDTVDSLLKLEKEWIAAGHVVEIPNA